MSCTFWNLRRREAAKAKAKVETTVIKEEQVIEEQVVEEEQIVEEEQVVEQAEEETVSEVQETTKPAKKAVRRKNDKGTD